MNRRSFLRRTMATAVGIAAGSFTADQVMAPRQPTVIVSSVSAMDIPVSPVYTSLSEPSYLGVRQWQRNNLDGNIKRSLNTKLAESEMDKFFGGTFDNGGGR